MSINYTLITNITTIKSVLFDKQILLLLLLFVLLFLFGGINSSHQGT